MPTLWERPRPPRYPLLERFRDRDPATWPDHDLRQTPQDLELVPDEE